MSDNGGISSRSDSVAHSDGSSESDRTAIQKIEGLFELLRSESAQFVPDGFPVGHQLADFEIIRPLAEGGMGRVYLARQSSLDRIVALKVSSRDLTRDQSAKERFINEGKVLARLKNPYVVPVVSQGEADGILFLVMEYVEGATLADLLHAISTAGKDRSASDVVSEVIHSQIKVDENLVWNPTPASIDRQYQMWVTGILSKVAEGLASVHRQGIVHRDVNPANIVLEESGEPRIVDFGLARVSCESSVTQTGQFLGTPAYASPEQLCEESIDLVPASDVYSFGVMLFECLCLRRPFETTSLSKEAIAKHTENPPLLRTQAAATPWELEAIADKCLNPDPRSRYETADTLAADLQNFLAIRPITAKKATAHRRLARAIRAKPWAFTASLLGIFLIALIAAGTISAARSAAEKQRILREEEYGQLVSEADAALFRLLVAHRPTWMKKSLEKIFNKSIEDYSHAIDLFPDRVWPVMQRGRLYASKQETINLAIADFRHAMDLRPEFLGAKLYLTHYDETDGIESDDSVSSEHAELVTDPTDLYWLATFYALVKDDGEKAYGLYSRCLSMDRMNYWARIEIVQLSSLTDIPSRWASEYRLQQLRLAQSLRPDLPFAGELIASWLGTSDRLKAETELKNLSQKFGGTILIAHELSAYALEDGKIDEAREILLKVKSDDLEGGTARSLGRLEHLDGNVDKAIDWYELAKIESVTETPSDLTDLAEAYVSAGRFTEAEDTFRGAISTIESMNPDELNAVWNGTTGAYLSFAEFLENQGRPDETDELYRRLLELEIHDTHQYAIFADFLLRREQPSEAIEILLKGIDRVNKHLQNPVAVDSQQNKWHRESLHEFQGQLCHAYMANQDFDSASKIIESMRSDRPYTLPQIRFLVDICLATGANEEAMMIARMGELTEMLRAEPNIVSYVKKVLILMINNDEISLEHLERIEVRRSLSLALDRFDYFWLVRQKSVEDAVAILEEAVQRIPGSYELWAYLALKQKSLGILADSNTSLETAITKYECEVKQLSQLSKNELQENSDFNSRFYYAMNCSHFFTHCMNAADEDSSANISLRIKRAHESIGGDPSIFTESQPVGASNIQQVLDLYEIPGE